MERLNCKEAGEDREQGGETGTLDGVHEQQTRRGGRSQHESLLCSGYKTADDSDDPAVFTLITFSDNISFGVTQRGGRWERSLFYTNNG